MFVCFLKNILRPKSVPDPTVDLLEPIPGLRYESASV